ncbi:MAG: glycosyltransferase [Pseudomonadota bacterium]
MDRPADVALMIHSLGGGGSERVCLLLAEAFRDRGLSVELLLCRAEGPRMADVPDGVNVVDFAASGSFAWGRRLAARWRRTPPRAALVFAEPAGMVALLARRLAGARTRVVVSSRNAFSAHVARIYSPAKGAVMRRAARLLLPGADALCSVSDGVSRDLSAALGLPRDRVRTIYNPVITADLGARMAEPAPHPWLERPRQGSPIIVTAGRLTEQKDHAMLLRAFAQVLTARPARLVIFGDGELRSALEALATDLGIAASLAMPGFTGRPHAAFARADLFVLSSAWEGLPNALIEAMACGAPVVSTDCPSGPDEILESGALGPLVPIGDAGALCRAILDRLAGPVDTAALRTRAQAFAIETSRDAYLDILGLTAPVET